MKYLLYSDHNKNTTV